MASSSRRRHRVACDEYLLMQSSSMNDGIKSRHDGGPRSNRDRFYSPGFLPLALVVLAMLGSVVFPARQTWVITELLRETTEVLAPARLLLAQLESGLGEEFGMVQGYALSGDTASLERYRQVSADDDRLLVALQNRLGRLALFASDFEMVRQRLHEWRNFGANLMRRHPCTRSDSAMARTSFRRYAAGPANTPPHRGRRTC